MSVRCGRPRPRRCPPTSRWPGGSGPGGSGPGGSGPDAAGPILARTRDELAAVRDGLGRPAMLVPTMGALHQGHRALLRRAREMASPNGCVVVSVFVNPLQFRAGEDFGRYPRSLEQDLAVCAEEGAA